MWGQGTNLNPLSLQNFAFSWEHQYQLTTTAGVIKCLEIYFGKTVIVCTWDRMTWKYALMDAFLINIFFNKQNGFKPQDKSYYFVQKDAIARNLKDQKICPRSNLNSRL